MPKGVFEESTSGSTAEPFRFLRSRRTYEWELGAQLRFFGWTGYRLGDRWAAIHRVSPFKSLREQFEDAARDVLLRRLRVNDWKISEEGLRRYAKRIFSFRPFLLVGLPKNLLEFGRFAHQENAGVPVLVSTMERIAPFERRLVNEMWGGEVYDMYGSAEARSVASECGEHDGLHISDELYVLEFVRDGEHVSPGEQGRILVTSLCHWVQPFIRYDTGDLSTSIDEECPCGRGLSLMSTVEGRYWDILETEDGRLIFAHRFADWFGDVEVRQYQIEQQSRLKTIVRIVPDEGYSEESGETIAARTKAILGSNVEVEIRVVDFISDYESGKRQVVKSKARFPAVT